MALTSAELRDFINKHFLSETPVNNIIPTPDPVSDTDMDLFLPAKTPSMHDITLPISDKPPVMAYKYLDDVILSNNLMLFPRILTQPYTIHLCLFSINTELQTPFLQFMFSKPGYIYQLPNARLDMAAIQKSTSAETIQPKPDTEGSVDGDDDDDEYDESSGVDAEFLSQCSDLLQKTVSIPDMDMHSLYRGFLEDEETATNLYVFFDCTGLNIETRSDKFQTGEYIMAIVDELNAGRINNIEISSDVLQIFNNNPFTKIINSARGEPIPIPIVAYLCRKNEYEYYANEYYTAENGYDNISLVIPVVTHARFDDIYMFSKTPVTGEYNNIKRFAMFYDETDYDVENMDTDNHESSDESSEESSEQSAEEGEEESSEQSAEEGDEESSEQSAEEGDEGESVEEGDEESSEESVEEGDEESSEESVEEGDEESSEESVEEGEEGESVEEGEEESSEESAEEGDEESSEESAEEGDEESGTSDESSVPELELAENAVFTFKENGQTYYGTYSLDTFIEL